MTRYTLEEIVSTIYLASLCIFPTIILISRDHVAKEILDTLLYLYMMWAIVSFVALNFMDFSDKDEKVNKIV